MIEFIKRYVLGFHENAERWEKLRVIVTLILIVLIINLTWVVLDARSDLKEYTEENCFCIDPEDQNTTAFFNISDVSIDEPKAL